MKKFGMKKLWNEHYFVFTFAQVFILLGIVTSRFLRKGGFDKAFGEASYSATLHTALDVVTWVLYVAGIALFIRMAVLYRRRKTVEISADHT